MAAGADGKRSVKALVTQAERCAALGVGFLILHMGKALGTKEEKALARTAKNVDAVLAAAPEGVMLLLENTAGSGSAIGSRFEELAEVRRAAAGRLDFPIGFCLDTAHCLAAGYDVATASGLEKTLRQAHRVLGLDRVPVIHTNDSKAPLGSHVDRHEHIGQGYIGIQGFRRILHHPRLRDKAFILETPIDREGDDRRNLLKLKRLCRKSRTTRSRSS